MDDIPIRALSQTDSIGAIDMPALRTISEIRLVNGSTGDPGLFIDYPGRDDALLFDCGENASLDPQRLGDLGAVFLTHHHVDHFIGFDRIVRANLDRDKALRVFGPAGTIAKVYDRIKSYEYPFFPFQKIVLEVHEVLEGRLRIAPLVCSDRFPKPVIREEPWDGSAVYRSGDLAVEAAIVDHTVSCLAFALVESPGPRPDPEKLAAGPIRPGAWVNQAMALLRASAPADSTVLIQKRPHAIGRLREDYFVDSPGARIAYVTDTAWSEASRPGLRKLARGANRLYCDSFYSHADVDKAEKYRHMTAALAAEFAIEAGVGELVLIHFSARYEGRYEALLDEARAIFPNTTAEFPPGPPKKSRSATKRS